MIPEEIYRRAGDSLERYNRITNIMINEYGYGLDETYIDDNGCTVWILTKKHQTDNNKEMNETYEMGGVPNSQQLLKDTFDWVLPLLPKRK
jgi:hypothetical protein